MNLLEINSAKEQLTNRLEPLLALKKAKYSNMDITSPMSTDEKQLNKEISGIFSELNDLVIKKRELLNPTR